MWKSMIVKKGETLPFAMKSGNGWGDKTEHERNRPKNLHKFFQMSRPWTKGYGPWPRDLYWWYWQDAPDFNEDGEYGP